MAQQISLSKVTENMPTYAAELNNTKECFSSICERFDQSAGQKVLIKYCRRLGPCGSHIYICSCSKVQPEPNVANEVQKAKWGMHKPSTEHRAPSTEEHCNDISFHATLALRIRNVWLSVCACVVFAGGCWPAANCSWPWPAWTTKSLLWSQQLAELF